MNNMFSKNKDDKNHPNLTIFLTPTFSTGLHMVMFALSIGLAVVLFLLITQSSCEEAHFIHTLKFVNHYVFYVLVALPIEVILSCADTFSLSSSSKPLSFF